VSAAPDFGSATTSTALIFVGERLLFQNYEKRNHFLLDLSPPRQQSFLRPEPGKNGNKFPVVRPQTNELVVDNAKEISFYNLGSEGLKVGKKNSFLVSRPQSAAFDASGRIMAVSTKNGEVFALDLNSNQRLPLPDAKGPGTVAINPAGTRGAILTGTGLQVWEISTGRMLRRVAYQPGAGPVMDFSKILGEPVFHPDGELVAFVETSERVSTLVIWDTRLGQRRAAIQAGAGIHFLSCAFTPDGKRVLAPCTDAKVRLWDWRLGKELLALSDVTTATRSAVSPNGLTIAYAGWNPSLRIARALPWNGSRDAGFYRAVDDFRIYSEQRPTLKMSADNKAEMLGDIHLRRGEATQAKVNYAKVIEFAERALHKKPANAELQSRLAALYEKQFAAAEAGAVNGGADVLQQAASFWQTLAIDPASNGYLLPAQLRLLDHRLAQDEKAGLELLQNMLKGWSAQAEKQPANHVISSSLRELSERSLWVSRMRRDHGKTERQSPCMVINSLAALLIPAIPPVDTSMADLPPPFERP
jgi:hypothetical protein